MAADPVNPWNPERIDDAFERVREDIAELKQDIRVFAPLVGDVAALTIRAGAIEKDVAVVETAVAKYVNKSVTRQLIIVSTPLFLATFGFIVALLAGVRPG